MGQFCYLGDVLNGEGGSSMASINRVRSGWKKFRELSGVLTNKKVALRLGICSMCTKYNAVWK